LEIFSGRGYLTLGVRAHGLKAIEGWDKKRPFGGRKWDFSDPVDQEDAEQLVAYLDPVIVHCAAPCQKLRYQRAASMVEFSMRVIRRRAKEGGGGSLENLQGSRCWELDCVKGFFGTFNKPLQGKHFARTALCAHVHGEHSTIYGKKLEVAATYQEILSIAKLQDSWSERSPISGDYPLLLGLNWGQSVAGAVLRLTRESASEWADRELCRTDQISKRAEEIRLVSVPASIGFATLDLSTGKAVNDAGEYVALLKPKPVSEFPDSGDPVSTVTAGEEVPGAPGVTEPILADAKAARACEQATCGVTKKGTSSAPAQVWMAKLRSGDLSGSLTPLEAFVPLRGEVLQANPRLTKGYKTECLETIGLGEVVDLERYGHLDGPSHDILKWLVDRGTSCMWLPDKPRTRARGFKHRLITKGPPIKVPLHRLSRVDTEWIDQAIKEDVERGQLVRGSSP
jgi:hypothetical protein